MSRSLEYFGVTIHTCLTPAMKKIILFVLLCSLGAQAQIADKLKLMKAYSGYFNFYYDDSNDKIYLEVNKLNEDFLYAYSLAQGVGNNDLGLDRGQLGNEQVVYFEKQGNKIYFSDTIFLTNSASGGFFKFKGSSHGWS
jgi:hypothetical protein